MTEWTSAKLTRFIRSQLENHKDLDIKPNFEVHTGILIRQGETEWKLNLESISELLAD